jgi:hypothetical protein
MPRLTLKLGRLDEHDPWSRHRIAYNMGLYDFSYTYAVLTFNDQTIYDVKTFNEFPLTPFDFPTVGREVANKVYVDWKVANIDFEGCDNCPTDDQKDAMDSAFVPSSTNPFATIYDLGGSAGDHDLLAGVSADDHHAKSHAHDGVDGSGNVAHSDTTGKTTDDHHAKSHAHDGVDGSGNVAHSDTTGKTTDDHHAKSHAHDGVDGSGNVAHSDLSDLGGDDHSQYFLVDGTRSASGVLSLSGNTTPSQITSNQNDYNPSGLSTVSTLRLSSDASRDVTGLAGGANGRIIMIHNVGSNDIVLKDENVGSSAANRFALTGDVTLNADSFVILQYDSTSSRWRAVSGAGGGGGVSDHDLLTGVSAEDHHDSLSTGYDIVPNSVVAVANVYGNTASGQAVRGIATTTGQGVVGSSASSYGVYGYSGSSYGVYGSSASSYGVYGYSANSQGLRGSSATSIGILGGSTSSYGVYGSSVSSHGLRGYSDNSYGLSGSSPNSYGVYGSSNSSVGMRGDSVISVGVLGGSASGLGVYGSSIYSYGVRGHSDNSYGVYGDSSTTYAGYFAGTIYATNKGSYISDIFQVTERVELGDIVVPTGELVCTIMDGKIPVVKVRKVTNRDTWGFPVVGQAEHPYIPNSGGSLKNLVVDVDEFCFCVTCGVFYYVKCNEAVFVGDMLVPGDSGFAMKKLEEDNRGYFARCLTDSEVFESYHIVAAYVRV